MKFDLTKEDRERFRWACYHFGKKHGETWSMAKTLRSLMHNFVEDMLRDSDAEEAKRDSKAG